MQCTLFLIASIHTQYDITSLAVKQMCIHVFPNAAEPCDQRGENTSEESGIFSDSSKAQHQQRVQVKQLLFTETYRALLAGH